MYTESNSKERYVIGRRPSRGLKHRDGQNGYSKKWHFFHFLSKEVIFGNATTNIYVVKERLYTPDRSLLIGHDS